MTLVCLLLHCSHLAKSQENASLPVEPERKSLKHTEEWRVELVVAGGGRFFRCQGLKTVAGSVKIQ